jgi:predicted nucleic acid-binding protein
VACVELWPELAERCITTEAVVTEASHLVARGGPASLPLELLLAARVPIVSLEPAGHEQAVRLMRRYASLPMDYADASLVVVADALRLETVFTLDRKGFRSYRRSSGSAFRMVPEP